MQPTHQKANEILDRVESVFVGNRALTEKLLAAALSNGHVLFEDNPGLGKTLLVKAFAAAVGCDAKRVQFTPDILPADILGTKVWNQSNRTFELHKGPVFTHVLLADEINRAPPKTQSALLEAMEERQVTIEGETMPLKAPFFVLATQNPIEQEGTYPLPEAQLDRFLLRMSTGYPNDLDAEVEILERRVSWKRDDPTSDLAPAVTLAEFQQMQKTAENDIYIDREVLRYIARIVRAIREHPDVRVGPSPRGSLALLRVSRAYALVQGRDYVTPDDVKAFVGDALAHRTILDLEASLSGKSVREVLDQVLSQTAVPTRFSQSGGKATG
ncbi:MAG TPA: MoxR family ATPase [Candidatus Thermoplasmatota archaeon]|nr:MoxR family ATPase [Candidatus Thermoplasmatota archaeon]